MKKVYYIAFLLVLFGCNKDDFTISNLNDDSIVVLGHGGMGFNSLYPINSSESILKSLNSGADGTEIDIQLTKDNVLVAFHDEDLYDHTQLEGSIRAHTWEELEEAYYMSTPFLDYGLLRVEDLFDHLEDYHQYIFTFDIKLYREEIDTDYYANFVSALEALFQKFQLHKNVFIESQSEEFIALLQAEDNLIDQYIYAHTFEEGFAIAQNLGMKGLSISNWDIDKAQVELAHDNGLFVTIWDVRTSSDHMEAVLKNPDMIQTDNIDDLIDLLD
ncbi:MAG: hypothetical protein JKY09_04005 [Crocinitomicaceae bacterium]|nr:hypothetical protein [Crocinitomicaceae bacterium]